MPVLSLTAYLLLLKIRPMTLQKNSADCPRKSWNQRVNNVTFAGRIISFRDFGKTAFAHIQDATGKMQVYFSKDIITGNQDIFKNLDIGDIIGVSGPAVQDQDK